MGKDAAARASEFHKRVISRAQFDVGGAFNPGDSSRVSSIPNWGIGVVGGPNKGDPFIAEHEDSGFLADKHDEDEHLGVHASKITPGDIQPYLEKAQKSGHMVRVAPDENGLLHIRRTRKHEHLEDAANEPGLHRSDLGDLIGDINPGSK